MSKLIRSLVLWHERGQSMIMVAVLMPILVGIMGLAVEGGRVFVEYRRMQAAADMAALVGAQNLPCSLTDTTCQSSATYDACTFAAKNGFANAMANCQAGTDPVANAYVPPNSCSPYDFMPYGNGACSSAAPPYYDYLEVQLKDNLGTIPIFNVPVTLGAHAVAKHGVGIPGDMALIGLNPSSPDTLDMAGSATVDIAGSAFANGGVGGKAKSVETCGGGWFSSGDVGDSWATTDSNGSPVYAPASGAQPCTGSTDTYADEQGNLAPITDPYSGSQPPPTVSGTNSYPGALGTFEEQCPQCLQDGRYYDLNSKSWNSDTYSPTNITGGSCSTGGAKYLELFPGLYGSYSLGNCDHVYFNPGVYTFTGTVDVNHGYACVYGAPDCDSGLYGSYGICSTQTFSPPSSAGDAWYSNCSPYGFYDNAAATDSIPNEPTNLENIPKYFDSSNGTLSDTPMNGVTLYFPASNTGGMVTAQGNPTGVYLASSNPCEGTPNTSSVTFPDGAASGKFSYPSYNPDVMHTQTTYPTSYPWSPLYPNMDFGLLEESQCANIALQDWPGEFAKSQHLHFLYYILGGGYSQAGTGNENFFGIVYDPNGTFSLSGNSGTTGSGPPWLTGQIVAGSESFSGNSTVTIQYRPCGPGSTPCGSGTGTMLVQ